MNSKYIKSATNDALALMPKANEKKCLICGELIQGVVFALRFPLVTLKELLRVWKVKGA